MKLPRDLDGEELVARLLPLGFERARQVGSHVQVRHIESGETVTIPAHSPLRVGTLAAILRDVGEILGLSRTELLTRLGTR